MRSGTLPALIRRLYPIWRPGWDGFSGILVKLTRADKIYDMYSHSAIPAARTQGVTITCRGDQPEEILTVATLCGWPQLQLEPAAALPVDSCQAELYPKPSHDPTAKYKYRLIQYLSCTAVAPNDNAQSSKMSGQ